MTPKPSDVTDRLIDELKATIDSLTANESRPDWDDVYMAMAFLASTRSLDPRTKHGCVIVSADNRPLTWGCNGPIRGIDDSTVPLTAPEKYLHMLHAEKNALLNYRGSYADFKGSTAYVTGESCIKYHCLPSLIQSGVSRLVQGHVRSVMIHNASAEEFKQEQEAKRLMVEQSGIEIVNVGPKASIRKVLQDAIDYFDAKAAA